MRRRFCDANVCCQTACRLSIFGASGESARKQTLNSNPLEALEYSKTSGGTCSQPEVPTGRYRSTVLALNIAVFPTLLRPTIRLIPLPTDMNCFAYPAIPLSSIPKNLIGEYGSMLSGAGGPVFLDFTLNREVGSMMYSYVSFSCAPLTLCAGLRQKGRFCFLLTWH